jgi:CDP-diacylglycerol---glycerol-3-phosphate 3-phosphatidyltransferase
LADVLAKIQNQAGRMGNLEPASEVILPKKRWSFDAFLRKTFKNVINPVAGFLLRIGLTPNMVTYLGVLFSIAVAVLIALNHISIAGIVMLVTAPTDVMDGAMARLKGGETKFGAFIDSVTDRFSELIILGGLLYYYIIHLEATALILVFVAAMGSVLVSYVKARAEALGASAKMGLLTRVERVLIMIPCLIFNIPIIALWILAVLTNVTALQRFFFVRKQMVNK